MAALSLRAPGSIPAGPAVEPISRTVLRYAGMPATGHIVVLARPARGERP